MSDTTASYDWLPGYLKTMRDGIAAYGHMNQAVYPTTTDPGPGYIYTVGLTERCGHEFLIVGLPIDVAHSLLNMFADLVTDSYDPVDGELVDLNNPKYPFRLTHMADSSSVGVARHLYPNVDVWQLVWPDKHGSYDAVARVQTIAGSALTNPLDPGSNGP
jgi:hypothetical protein